MRICGEKHQEDFEAKLVTSACFSNVGNRVISVDIDEDEWAKKTVELGDIAFWPPGKALCLFFGPTPISGTGEIRPASSTNIMGKLLGDLEILKSVNSGSLIKVDLK